MTTAALNNLWKYIDSISLSNRNKQWLADRLIESKTDKKRVEQQENVKASLTRAFHEIDEAKRTGAELQSATEFMKEMEQW